MMNDACIPLSARYGGPIGHSWTGGMVVVRADYVGIEGEVNVTGKGYRGGADANILEISFRRLKMLRRKLLGSS